jgi:hypothetical protein
VSTKAVAEFRSVNTLTAEVSLDFEEEIERLTVLSRSRTEPASQVSRAQMLLAYRNPFVSTTWPRSSALPTLGICQKVESSGYLR